MAFRDLVIVAGHSICIDPARPWQETNWILLPFQRAEVPCYIGHMEAGVRAAVAAGPETLLVFSGGYTRLAAGPRGEAQSYFQVSAALGWFGHPEVAARTLTEDFARDSFENLLYSICRFQEFTGAWPVHITFVSWEFKRERFHLHRNAIRWPASRFTYIGANDPPDLDQAVSAEARNRAAYERDPYSAGPAFRAKRDERNPFGRTPGYALQCPALADLLGHQGPGLYAGPLPWAISRAKNVPPLPAESD